MTLRSRIIMTMTALLAATCILFSAVSLVTLDRSLRHDADQHLLTVAEAIAQLVDTKHGTLTLDAHDREQVAALHGPDLHFAVFDARGRQLYGSGFPVGTERAGLRFGSTTKLDRNGRGRVTVWKSDGWISRIDRTLTLTFAAASLAIIGLGFILARLLADRILKPVQRIASLAEGIEAHDLSLRIDASGDEELGRLCASFDRMLERLERSFATERRFVADASHELRTPLAVIRAEIDLALCRPRSAQEYQDAFHSVDTEVRRLEALIDDLLDTMRDRSVIAQEPSDVSDIVSRVTERLRPAFARLALDIPYRGPVVYAHAQSIERATTAVLHNALTHGGAGSVNVRVRVDEMGVHIDVADDGPGFANGALEHGTERFWRADSARSRGGTGLGLSIARVLIEAHNGEIRLANGPNGGAMVSLLLPSALLAESRQAPSLPDRGRQPVWLEPASAGKTGAKSRQSPA